MRFYSWDSSREIVQDHQDSISCHAPMAIEKLAMALAFVQVMMANQRCGEEDAEAILSNLKMEGRFMALWADVASNGCQGSQGNFFWDNPTKNPTAAAGPEWLCSLVHTHKHRSLLFCPL